MKVYALVNNWDFESNGFWIDENSEEIYATLELAEQAKSNIDKQELAEHNQREAKRFERWSRVNAAKAILEANNFEGISDVVPVNNYVFKPYEYESRYKIVTLEVQE